MRQTNSPIKCIAHASDLPKHKQKALCGRQLNMTNLVLTSKQEAEKTNRIVCAKCLSECV